jgi:hypothetical protein
VPNPGDEQYQTQEMNTKITINTSVSGNNLNLVSNKGIFFLYAIFESLFPMTDAEILLARSILKRFHSFINKFLFLISVVCIQGLAVLTSNFTLFTDMLLHCFSNLPKQFIRQQLSFLSFL